MVHVILVPFGVALPFITLVMNYLGLRRGDAVAMQLARRWSTVMAIQFAVGAVTGTVISLEFGLLWPGLMGKWGDVFGIAFGDRGLGLLPRGHPDRHLHLRLEADEPAGALPRRAPAAVHRSGRRVLDPLGERLDEHAAGLHPRQPGQPHERRHQQACSSRRSWRRSTCTWSPPPT